MQKSTPLFPGFHLKTLRRKRRSPQQKLADQLAELETKTLVEMDRLMGGFVPADAFKPTGRGAHSRQRIFTAHNTFWGFMSQVLSADGESNAPVTAGVQKTVTGIHDVYLVKTGGGHLRLRWFPCDGEADDR